MRELPESHQRRLEEAKRTLTAWDPERTAPRSAARGLSVLFAGIPSVVYTITDGWHGRTAFAAMERLKLGTVRQAPFIRQNLLFDPMFTIVHPDESPFGVENRATMRADLVRDSVRWQVFNGALLEPLGFSDNIRVFVVSGDRSWIAMCAAFATGGRFDERDRSLLDAFHADMARTMFAWSALVPSSGPRHPMLELAMSWPYPAFAYTATREFLFANAMTVLALEHEPEWLGEALGPAGSLPAAWRKVVVPSPSGDILVFLQCQSDAEESWFDRAVVRKMQLPAYLEDTALLAMTGLKNADICTKSGKKSSTVNKYMERILEHVGAENRTEFVYKATRHFMDCELWPIRLQRFP